MGIGREISQWVLRFILLGIVGLLYYRIHSINPFFVEVFGSMLLVLSLSIPEEKIAADKDVLIITKLFCFNLLKIKKHIKLEKIKDVIVAGNLNFSTRIFDLVLPYFEKGRSSNEFRVIYKDGGVKTFRTAIYMCDLEAFDKKLMVLISEKNKPNSFSQPNYKEG